MRRDWIRRHTRLQIRVVMYVLVLMALFLRGHVDWDRWISGSTGSAGADSTLRIAGLDLAPVLIPRLTEHYREEYPYLDCRTEPGGTNHALEAMLDGRADAGFLARPPSGDEQRLFREIRGDSLLWYPAALGGLVLLRSTESPTETLSVSGLRTRLAEGAGRFFAPDPNSGVWDAFLQSIRGPSEPVAAGVVFLRDVTEVLEAVRADTRALGLVSSFSLPDDPEREGVTPSPILSPRTGRATNPYPEEIGSGDYPLFHHLYVAVPGKGSREGAKFVTFVTSAHGQHLVEQAGYLPARYVLREVYLTARPLGRSG